MNPSGKLPDIAARFAAAVQDNEVGIFYNHSGRLHRAVSSDGIRWRCLPAGGDAAAGLQPLCGGHEQAGDGPNLFCVNAAGNLVAACAGAEDVVLAAPFLPVSAAEPWYAEMPDLGETAIMWDGSARVYRAYFCGQRSRGRDPERLGCIGAAVSPDLIRWQTEPPVFAPNRFPRLFAPHVFAHQGATYLFYATSDGGELRTLRVAMAPAAEGPFERPQNDILACDCRTLVQTVPTSAGRLVFFGRNERGKTQPHSISRPGRLDFRADGTPFVRFYDALLALAGRQIMTTDACLNSSEMLVRIFPRNARDFRLSLRLRSHGAAAAGILFRTSVMGSDNITLWLDFESGAVLLRRGVKGRLLARAGQTFTMHRDYCITVWAEGAFADVFVDDEWVLSAHTEALLAGGFGVAARGGEARFEALTVQAIDN